VLESILQWILGTETAPPPLPPPPQPWVSKPIKFSYTPPPTIPSQAELAPSSVTIVPTTAVSNQFNSPQAAASNAAALVILLQNLSATSAYLQSVIMALYPTLGVQLDLASSPDVALALSRIYNTATPPSALSLTQYATLLATDMAFTQFALMTPADSPVQIQPLQQADVSLVTKTFEKALISSGVYDQTSPVLLRSLAGDQILFNSITSTLMQYPILAVNQQSPAQAAATSTASSTSSRALNGSIVDVSDTLTSTITTALNRWQSNYAGIYNTLASPDPTETALPSVVSTLASQPNSDLLRVSTMLTNLLATQHQPALQQSHDSVDNFVVPQLLSDTTSFAGDLDFMNQVAVGPSSNFGGSLGTLMSTMSTVNPGTVLNVGLTGSVATAAGGPNPPTLTPTQSSSLSSIPPGLQIMGANISWSQSAAVAQNNLIIQSFQRLAFRKSVNQGNQTEVLTSMKSISSVIGIVQSLLQSQANTPTARGNTTSLNTGIITPPTSLQSVGTLISSVPSQSGSSYAVDGNTLIITPPTIPTAPANVQAVLTGGGVKQFTTLSFSTPINLGIS